MEISPEVMNLYLKEVAARLDYSYCGVDIGTGPCIRNKLDPSVTPVSGSIKKAEKIVSSGGLTPVQFNTIRRVLLSKNYCHIWNSLIGALLFLTAVEAAVVTGTAKKDPFVGDHNSYIGTG